MSETNPPDINEAEKDEIKNRDRERCKKLIEAANELANVAKKLPKVGRGYELCISYSGFPQLISAFRDKCSNHVARLYNNAGCKIEFPKMIEDISKIVEANHFL
uniref:Uncharacterized protein n=1 Tax=Panagrolaimus sp. JU765 TaxID=591449 RepID=A0AC34R1C1_9BILA